MYDRKVKRKQKRIITAAKQSEAIISSLFPTSVMNQLYPTEPGQATKFGQVASTRPIAELYPETTVLFAGTSPYLKTFYNRVKFLSNPFIHNRNPVLQT